jgi:hypothetical protein
MSQEQGTLMPTGPINMADIDVPSVNYLEPGMYEVAVKEVKYEIKQARDTKKSPKPAMVVVFTTRDGKELTETFYLAGEDASKSKTMLGRLQYLHEAIFGGKITESFTGYDQIKDYFDAKLMSKKCPPIYLLVNGEEQEDGKVYSRLGFVDFIFKGEKAQFVEGPYVKDSEAYKKAVTKKKTTKAGQLVSATSAPVLNGAVGGAVAKAPWESAVN